MNIEGLGEALVDQLVTQRPGARLCRPLWSDRGWPARRRSNGWGEVGGESARGNRQEPARGALAAVHGIGIRHVGEGGARALATCVRPHGRHPAARRSKPWRRCPTSARWSRAPCGASSTSRATRALIDRLAVAGVRMEDDAPAGGRMAPGPLAGQTFVITGTLDVDEPRGGQARPCRRSAPRFGVGQQEDERRRRRRANRAASWRRREPRACPCSMRPAFLALIMKTSDA